MESIQENINLAKFTTFKIGGEAKFFIEVKTKEDLAYAFNFSKEKKVKIFILAGGSNVIINDEGVDGLVIKMANTEITVRGERLDCNSGASLARAVSIAMRSNLSGLEWASGIPQATIGGAVWGNAGAFGFSMSELAETTEVFNIKKNKFETLSRKDCKFGYRESKFKKDSNYLIWEVILRLRLGRQVEIKKMINSNMEFRTKKQPKLPSAGSVFKNLKFDDLKEVNPQLAKLAEKEGVIKNNMIGAAWLVDMAGLKGKTIGGAKVSLEHANFIVNTSGATAEDVVTLISYIKQKIRNRFKVQLQEEVQYFGF